MSPAAKEVRKGLTASLSAFSTIAGCHRSASKARLPFIRLMRISKKLQAFMRRDEFIDILMLYLCICINDIMFSAPYFSLLAAFA